MAISSEERKILDDFLSENKNLLCAVLNELKDEIDPTALAAITETVKDYSKYLFDGKEYRKGKLTLAIVKKYIADNPAVTYADLQKVFAVNLSFNKKPLVRLSSDVTKKELEDKRVFVDDVITLSDGTELLVNSQISGADIPEILKIAGDLGYAVTPI